MTAVYSIRRHCQGSEDRATQLTARLGWSPSPPEGRRSAVNGLQRSVNELSGLAAGEVQILSKILEPSSWASQNFEID